MTAEQKGQHEENREIVARVVQKWRRYRFLSEADQRRLMIALQRMRMSCDSTYLVDHASDFGVKADEATTLLGEMWELPDTKVVVFSQWLGMHELLVRRFKEKDWDHVLFHGGVPGAKRRELVDRFREDPDCRAFLATDAGGTGLNLQHASVVVNMDLPWNPAVLEQRIGRVHRLGQRQPVRVVNFVAQGTIEEGMLSVLKFKRSLFAGVLDGGEKDVFLGGSRLNKFMETVEKATGAIPQAELEETTDSLTAVEPSAPLGDKEETVAESDESPALPPSDAWSGLLQTGMALLQQFTAGTRAPDSNGGGAYSLTSLVQRDERTGERFVKLPVPPPQMLDQAIKALGSFLENLRR